MSWHPIQGFSDWFWTPGKLIHECEKGYFAYCDLDAAACGRGHPCEIPQAIRTEAGIARIIA